MELSIGITPTQLRNRVGNLCVKCGHWFLAHWSIFVYIILFIVALVLIYKYLRTHLSNYYKFKDEKSVQRKERTVQA